MADVIQSYAGGDYGRTATKQAQPFKGIVIHVTGKPDLKSELDYMGHPDPNRPGYYGYHYLIDTDGKVYQTAPDTVRTNHILPNSAFGLNNSNAIGVAFVGGAKGATPAQIDAGKALVGQLSSEYGIKPSMVVNHGELDPETRGPGHGLGVNDTAEGADFITAFRQAQPQSQPTQAASASPTGGPARPVTTTSGVTLNTTPMDLVAKLESGDRNVPQAIHDKNTDRGTPAGGYFQIIDPTWQRYAGAAGVDVKQYPTAMSAPRNIQAQVAGAIPLNQWGPSTVAGLKAQYPGIDTSQTLGAAQSAVLNGGSGAPGPIDPSILAHGGTSPPIPGGPVAPATPGTTLAGFPDKATSDDFTKGVKAFDKAWHGDQDPGQEDNKAAAFNFLPARNVSPLIPPAGSGQVSPQTYGTTLAGMMAPLQWGSQPPGQSPYANGPPAATTPMGTSLASLQQLQQMMAMYGDAGYG